ncbi:MAG: DUF2437 domain-containing protein [Bryobacteraceae bacterium]|nr:DUF2437 domain-containing protein [Bryobacteraceae bacterium]
MRIVRFRFDGQVHAGVLCGQGVVPVSEINARCGTAIPNDVLGIIRSGELEPLGEAFRLEAIPFARVKLLLPYEAPPKIWCIGLNFRSHAEDLGTEQP